MLHIFSNGIDYVIAETSKEAKNLAPSYIEDDMPLIQQPDDKEFPVWYNENENKVLEHHEGELVTHTMAEWVELLGKGYFATTEF